MKIRFATINDAPAIGMVNYTSWQETYRGIVGDAHLDAMNPTEKHEKWLSFFKTISATKFLLVVENETGEVIGYCCAGKVQKTFQQFDGEILSFYLLRQYHKRGWGKALFLSAIKELRNRGFQSCCVFVLKDNPTVGFYRSFKPDFELQFRSDIGGKLYDDVGLGWSDIGKLATFADV